MKTAPKLEKAATRRSTAARKPKPKPSAKGKMASAGKAAARGAMPARRADFGASIDGYLARQPPPQRAILEALRAIVEEAAPDAIASIKWGMPHYTLGRARLCALAAFKAHVDLILSGPPGAFADPDGLLEGEGKTGRHLKLRALDELPRQAVRGWLRAAAQIVRRGGG